MKGFNTPTSTVITYQLRGFDKKNLWKITGSLACFDFGKIHLFFILKM
jgi:hypothetical protein